MPELRPGAGLLDTSILVDPAASACLPSETSVSALSIAELAAGPHATTDPDERARRQEALQLAEASFDPLPFDIACSRAYGRVYAAVAQARRKPHGRRAVDLLIAATAIANDLALYTRNPGDLGGLESLLEIVDAGEAARA